MTATFALPARLLGIPGVRPLELEIVAMDDLGPRMRQIHLSGSGLRDFAYQPGQDVMLVLGGSPERPLSRRYTIRHYDPLAPSLELNIVKHGPQGAGAEWLATAQIGDRVNGVGPRGKIFLDPHADWHLFLADESGAPAALAMLEALPPGGSGMAFVEVATLEDQLPGARADQIQWLHRGRQTAAGSTELLVEAMRSATLPPGRGHVYAAAEVQVVAAVQQAALARGLSAEQISPKAYWGRARPNASNGEPERES